MSSLRKDLGIDSSSIERSMDNNKLYLGTFRITTNEYSDATISNMGLNELNDFINIKREQKLTTNRPVYI